MTINNIYIDLTLDKNRDLYFACRILYSDDSYLYVRCSGSITLGGGALA